MLVTRFEANSKEALEKIEKTMKEIINKFL
jgi:hypothetical protein